MKLNGFGCNFSNLKLDIFSYSHSNFIAIGPIVTKPLGIHCAMNQCTGITWTQNLCFYFSLICHFKCCRIKNVSLVSTKLTGNALQWRHNERDGAWNHQRFDCMPSRLFRRRSMKTSKLRITGLYEGYPPVTSGSPSPRPVAQKSFYLMM